MASKVFNDLTHVCSVLRQRRLQGRAGPKVSRDISAGNLIEVANLRAKERIAHFCVRNKIAIPFKVQGRPSAKQRQHFVAALRSLGIACSTRDFSNGTRFESLIKRVRDHPLGAAHIPDLLQAFIGRTMFSILPSPHRSIRAECVCEIKARSWPGILTERQLKCSFRYKVAVV